MAHLQTGLQSRVIAHALFEHLQEIGAITTLLEGLRQLIQLFSGDLALAPGHLLRAAHLQPLAILESEDVAAGIVEGIAGAGIEPGHATTHQLHPQLPFI